MTIPTPVEETSAEKHYTRFVIGSQVAVIIWALAVCFAGFMGAADGRSHAQILQGFAVCFAIGAALGAPGFYAGRRDKGSSPRKARWLTIMWWTLLTFPVAVVFALATMYGPEMVH
jgi:hypothetical protein